MKHFAIVCIILLFGSCTSMKVKKAIEELQNLPAADYSYIVQPTFLQSKETSETKFKAFSDAEDLRIGASGMHSYDKETKEQIDEKYWLKLVVLNSSQVTNIKDETLSKAWAKQAAKQALLEITNPTDYTKIEVLLIQQWDDGTAKSIQRKFFFLVPGLEDAEF